MITVCSTLTRAVVCNHKHKSYREVSFFTVLNIFTIQIVFKFFQIGSKLRQGKQGVAVHGGRVWSARPGCRLDTIKACQGRARWVCSAPLSYRVDTRARAWQYMVDGCGLLHLVSGQILELERGSTWWTGVACSTQFQGRYYS